MNARIRYVKDGDTDFRSMQIFKSSDGTEYRVGYDNTNSGWVMDAVSRTVVRRLKGTSSHAVKIAIKKALEDLGVKFSREVRNMGDDDGTVS